MIDYSLNETASRAKLAAKGVGYSWGMAEEVARAMFWLVERDLPGPAKLLELLSSYPTVESVKLAMPVISNGRFCLQDKWFCPIALGCALSDTYIAVDETMRIELSTVKCPILMLPFIADIALRTSRVITLELDNSTASTDGLHVQFSSGDVTALERSESVVIRAASTTENHITFRVRESNACRVIVEEHVWEALGAYAHHTYAPSTQSSRALGAGAGLNDND